MKNFRKKILLILIISIICISNIISQSISFNISKGNYTTISLFDEYGNKLNLYSNNNNLINGKTIFKTNDESVTIDYNFGELFIADNSIVVINPYSEKPIIYLIDGQVTLETKSLAYEYQILTPVSKYDFTSPAKINVISNEDLEYGIFYQGSGTSYNALTNQTIKLNNAQMIDMGFADNITLDIPMEYINKNINVEANENIVNLIKKEYANKEKALIAENKIISEKLRYTFLNDNYLLDIKPIQKSNNFDKITEINFVITGNGQGNISALDLSSLSGIVKKAKSNNENILLIDAGNTLRGSSFVNFDNGMSATKILDMIGYDIFVPGAIDFSNGINRLQQLDKISNVNFISSNALNDESLFFFDPFGLYLFDDFKIAVLGLSNPSDITDLMDISLANELILNNAQKAINEARKIADYVILVTNLNYEKYNTNYILNNMEGLDLIIDGNSNDATLLNVQNTPLIKTGVGYSEIQNYKINVKKDEVISTNYVKVYSSNLNESDNRLLSSLNIKEYKKDINLQNYLSLIEIPKNLSKFLISPMFKNAPIIDEKLKMLSVLKNEQNNIPDTPSFLNSIETTKNINPIESPNFKSVSKDFVENDSIEAPNFDSDSYIIKENLNNNTNKSENVSINAPNFEQDPYEIEKIATIVSPTFELEPYTIDEGIKVDKLESFNIEAPKFKPISFKVKKQEIIEKETSIDDVKDEQISETETAVVDIEKTQKASIYSKENNEIKTHIGLDTQLNSNVDFNDLSLTNNNYNGAITFYPYLSRGGFSFALKLKAEIDNNFNLSSPLYPFATTSTDIIDYSLDLIDHFKLYSASDKLNIDFKRTNFNNDIDSDIIYDEFGSNDFQFKTKISSEKTTFKFYLSDTNILKPFNDITSENSYINLEFSNLDLFKFKIGAIAIGNSSTLDIYPLINFDLIPVNNKDITINFNLGSSFYLKTLPTLDASSLIDPSNANLIPNYLINSSIDIISNSLSISLGANYLVTEDSTKFSTNLIHKETINSNLINTVNNNTLTALTKLNIDNDNIDFNIKYSIPFNASTFAFDNDLMDINLALAIGNFDIGGYYLQNKFISHLKNIANINSFLINNDTEFGGYINYTFNNLSFKTTLKLPSTSTVDMQLGFILNYNIKL